MDLQTPRGHDLTLLLELQELTPAQRIERNWRWRTGSRSSRPRPATMQPEVIFRSLAEHGVEYDLVDGLAATASASRWQKLHVRI